MEWLFERGTTCRSIVLTLYGQITMNLPSFINSHAPISNQINFPMAMRLLSSALYKCHKICLRFILREHLRAHKPFKSTPSNEIFSLVLTSLFLLRGVSNRHQNIMILWRNIEKYPQNITLTYQPQVSLILLHKI